MSDPKNKLTEEGSQLASITNQLKMEAYDGKMRSTDVMDMEQILHLIQSIPSKITLKRLLLMGVLLVLPARLVHRISPTGQWLLRCFCLYQSTEARLQ